MIDVGLKIQDESSQEIADQTKHGSETSENTTPGFKLYYVKQGESGNELEAQSVDYFSQEAQKIRQLQNISNVQKNVLERDD